MSKTLASILTTAVGVSLTAIGNPLGPGLILTGFVSTAGLLFRKSPELERPATALKQPRPEHVGSADRFDVDPDASSY